MTVPDDAAFADLVRDHRVAVYRYVLRRVAPADADDVVAEVFAAAWRHRDRLPDHVELWLYRTAWNALLHQFRSARRRQHLLDRLRREPVDDTASPAVRSDDEIRAALARLRPSDQELLRLHYWDQLDAADIAFVVGGSAATVRVRLHRARTRLAAHLPDPRPFPTAFQQEPTR